MEERAKQDKRLRLKIRVQDRVEKPIDSHRDTETNSENTRPERW
jgi:hypothetical protein